MKIERTIQINDLTPRELAELFCDMFGDQQATFFSEVWKIARDWPGAGWCKQSAEITRMADANAAQAIRTLASHLSAEDLAWVAASGAES